MLEKGVCSTNIGNFENQIINLYTVKLKGGAGRARAPPPFVNHCNVATRPYSCSNIVQVPYN